MKRVTLQFLEEIGRDNNREWFNRIRSIYEAAEVLESNLLDNAVKTFRELKKLNDFLNSVL